MQCLGFSLLCLLSLRSMGQHAPIRGEYYMVDEGKDDQKEDESNDE